MDKEEQNKRGKRLKFCAPTAAGCLTPRLPSCAQCCLVKYRHTQLMLLLSTLVWELQLTPRLSSAKAFLESV